MRVLLVCTANRCRSPIAAALLVRHLQSRGLDTVEVSSAGLLPGGGRVPTPGLIRMQERGVDLRTHVSTQVSDEVVERADLVLGMGRDHVRDLVAARDSLWRKSFTLKDFVRRAGDEPRVPDQDAAAWIGDLATMRDRRQLLRASRRDDVADPMGRSEHVWNAVVAELDEWTGRLAGVLVPSRPGWRI